MGSSQSSKKKQNIIWGPTSFNLYENTKTNKKIIFIGDKHSIPTEKLGISLNELLASINVQKGIGFITEGCDDSKCLIDDAIDNCMKRAQTCNVIQKKFTTLWGDYREKLDTYDLLVSSKILNIYLKKFMNQWNSTNQTDPQIIENMKKLIVDNVKKLASGWGKVFSLDGKNVVKNTMDKYPQFNELLNKLSNSDKQNILGYINKQIYKGKDKQEYEKEYDKYRNIMTATIKKIFVSFTAGKPINSTDYRFFIEITQFMSKTFHDINDTIFEAYMIMLVLGTNFNRYIIHAGAAHIDYLENWFKSTLEYNEYFQAKLINDQTVDISGLVFL
jgi:hypothetical protein